MDVSRPGDLNSARSDCRLNARMPLMDRVEEIESAIDRLSPEDYKRVLAWLREHEQLRWDEQMDRDSSEGRLDFLFKDAESESTADICREWPPRT